MKKSISINRRFRAAYMLSKRERYKIKKNRKTMDKG